MFSSDTPSNRDFSPLRFVFVSSCDGNWGGSEELWAGTALVMAQAGHTVHTFKTNVNGRHPRLAVLRAAGSATTELAPPVSLLQRITNRLLPSRRQYTSQLLGMRLLHRRLQKIQPNLILISQGSNYDGYRFADVCRRGGFAYVILSHKATNGGVPQLFERNLVQQIYQAARQSFFVSKHNLELTQLQLGLILPGAEIVRNPYNVPFQGEPSWPATIDGITRLACVGRLFLSDKGQDVLLQVLAQDKWRQRAVHLTFYGTGPDEAAIRGMVDFLRLETQVSFGGHVDDIAQVWQTHHALVLPSRYEGLPLVMVEAMLSGRPVIAADAGGIAELLDDNKTGFMAAGTTFQALDEALERSWAARSQWPQMGAEAARQVRIFAPVNATELLAQKLLVLAQQTESAHV